MTGTQPTSQEATMTHPATPGQKVIYHGSMEEFRGPAVYLGICDDTEPCSHCDDLYDRWEFYRAPAPAPIRYRLQLPNYAELRCVRAESFTAVVPDATATL